MMSFWADTFSFNGISCTTFDLMLYDIDSNGSDESEFASTVSIVDDIVGGHWRPMFYGVKYQKKLTFDLVFGVNQCRIDQGQFLSRREIDSIAGWLTQHEQYRWLTIGQEDMADIRYRCFVTGLRLVNYGKVPWAFKATITCDGPFAYSMPQEDTYQVNEENIIFIIENQSNAVQFLYPRLQFIRNGGTAFSFENFDDNNRRFELTNIPNSITEINIDGENCILTNDMNLNLYDKCNFIWPRLVPGENTIAVTGNGILKIMYEYPINVGG